MGRASTLVVLLGFVCVLSGVLSATEQFRSGQWAVVFKDSAPKCQSESWANEAWTGVSKGEGAALISLIPPTGDVGKPAKFIVMFGNAETSGDWTGDADKVAAWWNCQGEGQWDWYIECAFDVLQFLDLNAAGKFKLWVCLETTDGKRFPYYGASPNVTPFNEADRAKLHVGNVQLPADYKWNRDKGAPSRAGAPVVEMKPGTHKVVHKNDAPTFQGWVWAFDGWVWTPAKIEAAKTLIQWPAHQEDATGGEVTRYLVYFANVKDGTGWYPNSGMTRDYFQCTGKGQWDWYLECAPETTQIIDNVGTGSYLVYVAVEYASGKRVPLYGDNNVTTQPYTADAELAKSAISLPEGYKWPSGEPQPKTGKPVWQELGGAKRVDRDLQPGSYRVLNKEQVGEWKGDQWAAAKWRGNWVSRRQSLITWAPAAADGDNKPVKFIVLISKEFSNSPDWFHDAAKVKDWFECKGDRQQSWLIECAPDVNQILDLNSQLSYYVWVAVEFTDGKRYPWFKEDFSAGWPKLENYDDSKKGNVQATCLKLYEDHNWAGQLKNESDLKPGEYRIVTRETVKPFTGSLWSAEKFYGKMKTKGRQETLSWPTCSDDAFGNKAVKYIVYYGKRDAQTKWYTDSKTVQKWFDLQGQSAENGMQYDWCLECAADVTQILDTNKDSDYYAWVVVEFSNGKRSPFYSSDWPTQAGYSAGDTLRKNVVKLNVTTDVPK